MSSFLGLHTALSGVRAGQVGLDTASHNVANANTPGYTRQRVNQVTRPSFASSVGSIGTGVDVDGVSRLREGFLDTRVRTIGAGYAASDTKAALLQRTEDVLGEPDNGLSTPLGEVFDAFDDLAINPADPAARAQVVATVDALGQRFSAVSNGWTQLKTDTEVRRDTLITDVNDKLARVDALNKLVGGFGADERPNDLLDERDLLLDELATTVGATFNTDPDGMVTVSIDGQDVAGPGVTPTGTLGTDAAGAVTIDGTAVTAGWQGGELGALAEFVSVTLPGLQDQLNALATDIAARLNDVHDDGVDLDGNPGGALISLGATPAATMTVATAVRADTDLIAAATTANRHDGRNAADLAALREGVPGEITLDEATRNFGIGLGQQVATATAAADAKEALYIGATISRQSAHSVSLDEEMVSLVQYQRALEASARVMTTVDQALDTLINRTGIVGR